MVANLTTLRYLPKPDYSLARTLYDEIDELYTRIALLTKGAKLVGVYAGNSEAVQRMLSETVENQLIPVENWAQLTDIGGLRDAIQWMPIEQIVAAIQVLQTQLADRINQLFQVTGMSDIIRGMAAQGGATATEQRIKAQFASSRIQALQEEFAGFAEELLAKKVQLIQRFYDPQRILELSNIAATPDAQFAEQAVALIKNPDQFSIRVKVSAESMALVDYEQLKADRTEFLMGISQFLGMATPLIEKVPGSAPFMMQLMKFGMSGFRSANEMEGIIDSAIAAVEKKLQEDAQQPPPPDPEMVKAQAEVQKIQLQTQADQQQAQVDVQKMQAELQLDQQRMALEVQKMQAELQFLREKHQLELEKIRTQLTSTVISAQAKADAAEAAKADRAEGSSDNA
jgi:hypothetical protein